MKLRYIFLTVAVLFIGVALIFQYHPYFQGTVSEIKLPIISVDSNQIHTINIVKAKEELLLSRMGNRWIASNGKWSNTLSRDQIQPYLENLGEVFSKGIATMDPADWGKLNISDEKAIHIRIYDERSIIKEFYLAKGLTIDTLEEEAFFLRLPENNLVYKVEENLGQIFLEIPKDLRGRKLLDIDPKGVNKIQVFEEDSLYMQLEWADSVWINSFGQFLQKDLVNTWLEEMAVLEGNEYADRFSEIAANYWISKKYNFYIGDKEPVSLFIYVDTNNVEKPFVFNSDQYPKNFFQSDSTGLFKKIPSLTNFVVNQR